MQFRLDTNICIYLIKKKPIGSLDLLIAAPAKSLNTTLITNNFREFSRIPGLQVDNRVV
jgi:tRNA(fMet)-specific endonuclease VapC